MFEAYKIGIRIALVNHASAGLLSLSKDFAAADAAASRFGAKASSIGRNLKLMAGGGLAIGAGVALAAMFKPALEAAKEFETAKANFGLLGLTSAQNTEAVRFAKNMNVVGSTYVENMNKMTEAQGVFREAGLSGMAALDGAKLAAPTLARLSVVAKMSGHAMSEADDKELLRAIEMSGGLKDAATFNHRADAIYKMVGSSGGNVKYTDIRQFYARGGVAAQSLTDEALMKLEPIIGEMKGGNAGVSLRTSFNRLNGIIRLPNQVAHALVNNGLWDKSKIVWNSMGGIKSMKGNPLTSSVLMQTDVETWERTVLEPMYARMGVVTQNQKNVWNGLLFGSTGGAFFTNMQKNAATIARSPTAINKHLGINQALDEQSKTFAGQQDIAAATWKNIMTNIGDSILPKVNDGMTKFNLMLGKIADWTRDNPAATRIAVYAAAIAAGSLVVVGGLALISGALLLATPAVTALGVAIAVAGRAMLLTPIGLAITGIATAAFLLWKNWDEYGPKLHKAWDFISNGVTAFINKLIGAWNYVAPYLHLGTITPLPTASTTPAAEGPSPAGRSKYIQHTGSGGVNLHGDLNVDGQKLAKIVAGHMGREATRPQSMPGSFDGTMTLRPMGMR